MAQRLQDDERRTRGVATGTEVPRTASDLRDWVREEIPLVEERANRLFAAIESVLAAQRQLIEESKHEAIRALSEGFAEKMSRLQRQLTEKDVTVSNIARYFEEVVAGLTEKSHRDPKTKLLNFDWFMERLESFLSVEQRVRWCGIGVVDINSFKWYNDTLGHAVGDKIIERVARILSDQIRSEDFLALERGGDTRDLHARFGGDEFCFLIPICPDAQKRSRSPIGSSTPSKAHDWSRDDRRLATRPGPRRRRRRLPASRARRRAPRRRAQARGGTDPPRRSVDVRRQGQQGRPRLPDRGATCENSALVDIHGDFAKCRGPRADPRRS